MSFFSVLCITADALIRITDDWRYAKGNEIEQAELGTDWYLPDYEDASWRQANGGFVGGATALQQATRLRDFGLEHDAVCFRTTFEVADPAAIHDLVLRLQFKHGIILWLNGQPILNVGFGNEPASEVRLSTQALQRPDNVFELLTLNDAIAFLQQGTNTLAAQVHRSAAQNAFAFVLELSANFSRQAMVHHVSPTQALISWQTPRPTSGQVHYGLVRGNLQHSVAYEPLTNEPEVMLESLQPGCTYHYQVSAKTSTGIVRSALASFSTPDDEDTSLRFSLLGDSGGGSAVQYRLAEQIRLTASDLVMHTGDMVYPSLVPELVDLRYYSIYGPHMRSVPYYVATGNHDVDRGRSIPSELFHRPTNDTSAEEHAAARTFPESYYTVRHGPAQFFVLLAPFFHQYALTENNPQHLWLKKVLRASISPWKFIVLHHPIRTSSLHRFDDYNRNFKRDAEELRDLLMPLMKEHSVQMIFSGHDHVYERFQPVDGTVNIITAGGGGSLYPLREYDVLSTRFLSQYHFVHVDIEGNTCRLDAIDDAGHVFDSFVMQRDAVPVSSHASVWHSPLVEEGGAGDADGNLLNQRFDFIGAPLVASMGRYSHAGTVRIHNDADHLYLGFESLALPDDGALILFMGQANMQQVDAVTDLAFLDYLEFEDWQPQLIGVLGDEFADGTYPSFDRSRRGSLGPQGVFHAGETLTPVQGARIQQYNLSPQAYTPSLKNTHLSEQNANFVEIAIPWASVPAWNPNEPLRLSVLSGRQPSSDRGVLWSFDHSLIGGRLSESDPNRINLQGVLVEMAKGADTDGDGLSDPEEASLMTDASELDTDGDGLPDGWEVMHTLSPLRDALSDGSEGDPDHDGHSNLDEWLANTHPRDSKSRLSLRVEIVEAGEIRLIWQSMPGVTYELQSSFSPKGPYEAITPIETFSSNEKKPHMEKHHLTVSNKGNLFFRVMARRKGD
ncbi:metallophosphoesterase [Verrucomicrobia bacterium]|nr:metallophosphoesterase [Verrucomicrobiota bacterium]MDC0323792.1 metallophosphoesterase [Verrucomicrobiota bacterium]